jgi:hypothetical protein
LGSIAITEDECRLDDQERERRIGACFSVLRTPADLFVGIADVGELGEDERLILAGDFTRIAFPEVASLVAQSRISGVMRVVRVATQRTIVFSEGEVRGAASERLGERLHDVMVRMGMIEIAAMDALLAEADDARLAGRLAVERGLISQRELWNAVQEHVTTVFQAILLEGSGAFVLTDGRDDETLTVPGLSCAGLLMEGVRRIDEMRAGGPKPGARPPESLLQAYNGAFRDIFATAAEAGAGQALRSAASSVFEEDPTQMEIFGGIDFAASGDLPVQDLLERTHEVAARRGKPASDLLSDALSTVLLFLLFVAGEHLTPEVHRALHMRTKMAIAR